MTTVTFEGNSGKDCDPRSQSKIVFVTTVTFEGNSGKDCDPRSQLKIVFCATATAQETENFVSAVTSGATAIQDLSQRLNFVTTVTIEGNIGKTVAQLEKKGKENLGKGKRKSLLECGDHSHNWKNSKETAIRGHSQGLQLVTTITI